MTEQQEQGQSTPENESMTYEEAREEERTFTQKDMDKVAGQRAKEAKKAAHDAAIRALLEKAGAESVDDLIAGHQSFKTIEEETATETDKERKAREKAESERDDEIQKRKDADERATNILIRSELKASLMAADARQDRLARLIKEADLSSVEVEEDEVKNLDGVIETLKTEIPEWFGNAERKPSGFDPVPPGDPDGATKEQEQANQEIAARQIHRMF